MASVFVHAQEWRDENRWHDPFDIYAGPVVGVAASNLTEYDGKYLFGPYIGGIIQTYFNNHWGMSFELAYTIRVPATRGTISTAMQRSRERMAPWTAAAPTPTISTV